MPVGEGDLATAIWTACLDAGHPIGVPASRHAAAAALTICDPPPTGHDWPALMVELHEHVPWTTWANPGLLAEALRRHADRLDTRAHEAMLRDAWDAA